MQGLGESDLHLICPKGPAPQYQPLGRKKEGNTGEDKKGASRLGQ